MNENRYRQLLAEMFDRQLTKSELRALDEAMLSSYQLRNEYLQIAKISADLEWEFSQPLQSNLNNLEGTIARSPSDQSKFAQTSRFSMATAIAAALMLALSAALWWSTNQMQKQMIDMAEMQGSHTDDGSSEPVIATLTGAVDCVWGEAIEPPIYGAGINTDKTLNLESGLVQLTFESGAKVILEGPAEVKLHNSFYASLNRGKATAVVPEEAVGFRVDTPSAEIIDLGTSFGINVSESGASDIHVLEGEILSRPMTTNEDIEFVHLLKDHAMRYLPDSEESVSIEADAGLFVTDIRPRLLPKEIPELPVRRSLALWLSADSLVEKDAQGRVIAWNDIRTGDNQSDEVAWQSNEEHRPLWIESGIAGKPTIRFEREFDHLVTTPVATTSDQTVFIAFSQHRQFKANDMRQLINYNGPPTRYHTEFTDPGILQIDDRHEQGRFYGRAHVYGKNSKRWTNPTIVGIELGECVANEPKPLHEPGVLTYIYSHTNNYSALYMDGKLQSTSTALLDIAIISRKVIGKHGKPLYKSFHGDISEVIIFNDQLTQDELTDVNNYLLKKYDLK